MKFWIVVLLVCLSWIGAQAREDMPDRGNQSEPCAHFDCGDDDDRDANRGDDPDGTGGDDRDAGEPSF